MAVMLPTRVQCTVLDFLRSAQAHDRSFFFWLILLFVIERESHIFFGGSPDSLSPVTILVYVP
jgi:hypothetical protein